MNKSVYIDAFENLEKQYYGLFIRDHKMSEMTGLEFLEEQRLRNNTIPEYCLFHHNW